MCSKKCSFGEGVEMQPDGHNMLDPCAYELAELHKNVTVEVLKCKKCGNVSIGWYRQANTEDIIYEKVE